MISADPLFAGEEWERAPTLREAHVPFENKQRKAGEVKFTDATLADNYMQEAVALLMATAKLSYEEIVTEVTSARITLEKRAKVAPKLFSTALRNVDESTLFGLFDKHGVRVPGAPTFKEQVFFKLIRRLTAERGDFFPLTSWVDRRRLSANPNTIFVSGDMERKIPTAAASPTGQFYYNKAFLQRLLDWGHLKGIRGNTKKYVSQGGDIPDEYAYVEFVVMHEYMHYTNDDFYYQNIIPDAKSRTINFVGDYRTNYFLVKSGFVQLPIGLFSDDINLDRQRTYKQMYDLVQEELDKLADRDMQDPSDMESDSHEQGQSEGGSAEGKAKSEGATEGDIDKHQRRNEEQAAKETDGKPNKQEAGKEGKGSPGSGRTGEMAIDTKHIRPTFSWKEIIRRFVTSARPLTDTNWSKIARRSITGMEVVRARGAGAIQPGEVPLDSVLVNLCLMLDTSGSMSSAIPAVYSNVSALMKTPAFAKNNVAMVQFSDGHDAYAMNFKANKAGPLDIKSKHLHTTWTTTAAAVMSSYKSGGTNITSAMPIVTELLKRGFNILICSDTDMLYEPNKTHVLSMLKTHSKQIFWILPDESTYQQWIASGLPVTTNVSYFSG